MPTMHMELSSAGCCAATAPIHCISMSCQACIPVTHTQQHIQLLTRQQTQLLPLLPLSVTLLH